MAIMVVVVVAKYSLHFLLACLAWCALLGQGRPHAKQVRRRDHSSTKKEREGGGLSFWCVMREEVNGMRWRGGGGREGEGVVKRKPARCGEGCFVGIGRM